MIGKLIEELAGVSSRNEKERILAEAIVFPIVADVLEATYNPYKTYGVVQVPVTEVGTGELNHFRTELLDLLYRLRCRMLTGNEAILTVQRFLRLLVKEDQQVLLNILAGDQRCGISDKTINKVSKGLIPTFDVMLAEPEHKGLKKIKFPCAVSTKYDGFRCVVVYDGTDVRFLSRSGKEFNTLDHLKYYVVQLMEEPGVLDCEVVADTFNELASSVKRKEAKNTDARLVVFDYLTLNEFQTATCKTPWTVRYDILIEMFDNWKLSGAVARDALPIELDAISVVTDLVTAREIFNDIIEGGGEGVVLKNLDAPYSFKRSANWTKLKAHIDSLDLEIVGFLEGTGKNVGKMGTMQVDYNGVVVGVGTGFSDEQRADFWARRGELVGQIAEIEAMEETVDSSLRHPAFVTLRSFKGAKA